MKPPSLLARNIRDVQMRAHAAHTMHRSNDGCLCRYARVAKLSEAKPLTGASLPQHCGVASNLKLQQLGCH